MPGIRGTLAVACATVLLSGCDDFFSVKNPGAITPADLENAQLLPAIRLIPEAGGAESHDDFIRAVGLISNDLTEWQTRQDDLNQDWGVTDVTNGAIEGLYNSLASNSWVIREARRRLLLLEPAPATSQAIALSYFWEAQILIDMADVFQGVTMDAGKAMTPVETYNFAINLLKEGLPKAQSTSPALSADYIAAFYGLMARAERQKFFETGGSQANLTAAAGYANQALAARATFRVDARYSAAPGKTNGIQTTFGTGRGATPLGVQDTYGDGWRDPVTNLLDRRVMDGICGPGCAAYGQATVRTGPQGRLYYLTKFATNASPIPMIRWQEMTLILAEERERAGDLAGAITRINQVRAAATFTGTTPATAVPLAAWVPVAPTQAQVRAQIFYERQTEFFVEGRNWQDARNYGIIPVKWNAEGRAAGLNRRLPISAREIQTNPNL